MLIEFKESGDHGKCNKTFSLFQKTKTGTNLMSIFSCLKLDKGNVVQYGVSLNAFFLIVVL